MPRLSCWLVRCALLHLVVGFSLGAWMLSAKALAFHAIVGAWRAIHAEILLIGWLIQLAMGVSYWILPRDEQNQRQHAWRVWGALGTLNLGVGWSALGLGTQQEIVLAMGRVMEVAGVILYATAVFPRLRRASRLG
ncbi:MAG: hypothetical protein N2045_00845 [Fimbriimonadales bacterium]|jgi:hypothetical protein|nr:hypothetical protein [Armatimonadota bacterium]MCX7686504.1 hypothetical protein [Fimbriimonadales bacterium]CUU11342.1 hypothetical protein GBSOP10_111139 [Armatimonadetes bacterium GBS]CUU35538.1 hypothetical protein DCOP10_114277 [Armatimonadetes bacterium DC]CUU37336.1 hypothetical protein GXSOP10_1327 [Armatimonadetes bacterium GXS]GBC90462.1 hypothetical protein HRbin14_01198 [bacterium HR14]